jgi:DNA repair protein RecO (recombination protein O)
MNRQSEAIVLRTYPMREADLLVTLFTRSEGKIRGVAKSAKKSKRRFGGALEPLTWVRANWDEREKQDLARLDACEIVESPLSTPIDYPRAVALAHVAEVLDELLPDREVNDAVFRLAVNVLGALRNTARLDLQQIPTDQRGSKKAEEHAEGLIRASPCRSVAKDVPAFLRENPRASAAKEFPESIWLPLTYFDLWMLRLVGFLPDLTECITCGMALNGGRVFYHALADGLMCQEHKRLASSEISPESRALAAQMFRASLEKFAEICWPRERGADLRRFLAQAMERHLERKLATVAMLERL